MFVRWLCSPRSLLRLILVHPLVTLAVHLGGATGAAQTETIERLPPVFQTTPVVINNPPTELKSSSPAAPRRTPGLLLGDAFGQRLESIPDDGPLNGTHATAWTAIEAAQTTLSQGYYGGADYLLIRPHLSEPAAFLFGHGNDNQVQASLNNFDFNYQSSPRIFLGYRSPVTGSGIQFTYWHFEETATSDFTAVGQNSGFIPDVNFIWFLIGQGDNNSDGPDFGSQVHAQMHLRFNIFDIDLYKPVAFSGGRWLLTGTLGARIMDFSQSTTTLCYDSGSSTFNQYQTNSFTGAGPKLAIEGRRNIGNRFALYARGGYSILLGSHAGSYVANDLVNVSSVAINESLSRMVNVADIELGASWRATDRWALSAGYMFQVWTNLANTGGLVALSDTSNTLSFDGLVARASLQF